MTALQYGVMATAAILLLTAAAPAMHVDWWWVRIWDFPRVQLLVLYIAAVGALAPFCWTSIAARVMALGLAAGIGWQLSWIYPYLPISPIETERTLPDDSGQRLRLMTVNVLQSNRSADKLIQLVRERQPDVLVAVEVDDWWIEKLEPIEGQLRRVVAHPLDNKYGIALYSRLEASSSEVRFFVEPHIPAIDATVVLDSGDEVRLLSVHPTPPRPGDDSTERDAELVLVGKEAKRHEGPVVVLGDLNDVAWSPTTQLFQKVSGLLDPRKGRGMYPTFHADYPLLQYPLDHVFHSDDLRLVHLEVLPSVGSDHFPLWAELSLEPAAETQQEAPAADRSDEREAEQAVQNARDADDAGP